MATSFLLFKIKIHKTPKLTCKRVIFFNFSDRDTNNIHSFETKNNQYLCEIGHADYFVSLNEKSKEKNKIFIKFVAFRVFLNPLINTSNMEKKCLPAFFVSFS